MWYICLPLLHIFTTGTYGYHWHICLPLVHMFTSGTYVYHWYIFLPLVHMVTTGTYGYHRYIFLPLVHMVTTGTYFTTGTYVYHCAFKICVILNLLFLIKFCFHWMPCKMLEMTRRYEMSKTTVLLIGTFLAAELTVVGIRAERLVMSRRWVDNFIWRR
jgi:hypothetical protein